MFHLIESIRYYDTQQSIFNLYFFSADFNLKLKYNYFEIQCRPSTHSIYCLLFIQCSKLFAQFSFSAHHIIYMYEYICVMLFTCTSLITLVHVYPTKQLFYIYITLISYYYSYYCMLVLMYHGRL